MIRRYRQLGTAVLAAACIFAVAACGSSSSSASKSAASATGGGAQPVGLKLTTTQRSCLKKHGVTLPTDGFGGRGGGGRFTGGKGGTPPRGARFPARNRGGKAGAHPGGRGGFAHDSVASAALKACGVSFGSGPAGPGAAGTTTAG